MTQAALQSLQSVLQHAESERDAAATTLRQAEAAAARSDAQASQLSQYRGDYRQRWSAQFALGGTASLLHCHHGFGQRLDQAIAQQQLHCASAAQRVAQARGVLQAREQRVAAVRKLIERRLAGLRQQADRREQKQTDEAAQRAGWAARAMADQP